MNDKTIIKLWAMSLVGLLEVVNMLTVKIDGAMLTGTVAAICGLAGYIVVKEMAK